MNIVITGTSKGIGHEFVRQYAIRNTTRRIFACSRTYNEVVSNTCIKHIPLDVSNQTSIIDAAKQIENELQDGESIDLIINNAGVMIPYETFDNCQRENVQLSLDTNFMGPLFLCQQLQHLLTVNSKIVNVSSQMGSLSKCTYSDGNISYRCSKAALNMMTILLSNYCKKQKIVVVAVHPGHVQTDTGSHSRKKPPLTPNDSVTAMIKLIDSLTLENNTGRFYNYDGTIIPW
jgi:NAD(P)-dependent dehydrogenase (short-subunit alcohol dehydrogenase family)